MSYLRYLCLFQYSGVQHYMSNMAGVSLVEQYVGHQYTQAYTKNTIRHEPSYNQLEVKTNRTYFFMRKS
jgi:hypothetical protein